MVDGFNNCFIVWHAAGISLEDRTNEGGLLPSSLSEDERPACLVHLDTSTRVARALTMDAAA